MTNPFGPDICVAFDGDTPVQGIDFTVDYLTDPANPSVSLKKADLTWNVRSDDSGSPGNIGTISLDTSGSDDFEVTIANGAGAGAADVGTINLTDAGWTGFSTIEGGHITGDLTGDLTLQREPGSGGLLTLTIDGDSSGDMTVYRCLDLKIGGDASGAITITTAVEEMDIDGSFSGSIDAGSVTSSGLMSIGPGNISCGSNSTAGATGTIDVGIIAQFGTVHIQDNFGGTLTVDSIKGGLVWCEFWVTADATVNITDMETLGGLDAIVRLGPGALDANPCHCDGDLVLNEGVPAGQEVSITGELRSGGSVDLKNKDVAAFLFLYRGGAGTVINGGAVTSDGEVNLGGGLSPGNKEFSGTATFTSVAGLVETRSGGEMSGTVTVTGSVSGDVDFSGDVSGDIVVGSVSGAGTVNVDGDVTGDIDIKGDMDGDVTIGGALSSAGATVVGRILVSGRLNGDIAIDEDAQSLTLIRLTDGIGPGGTVTINQSRGVFDLDGTIHVGITSVATPLPNVTFDGSIMVKDDTDGNGGDFSGLIKVVGCHNSGDLDICICGDDNGTITLVQGGCAHEVDHSCVTGCPNP